MGIVRDLARHGMDKALTRALETLVEKAAGGYGKLVTLKLDTRARSVELELLLRGEDSPLTVTVSEYRIVSEEGRTFVIVENVSVSREWMHLLARDLLKGARFEVPSKYARLVDALI